MSENTMRLNNTMTHDEMICNNEIKNMSIDNEIRNWIESREERETMKGRETYR